MKKSLLLLIVFVFSAYSAAFSQVRGDGRLPVVAGEFVEFERIDGFTDGMGAFLRWEMKSESGNVGFLVYRMGVGENQMVLAGPGLIQGSVARTMLRPLYNAKYEFFDEQGTVDSNYVIVSLAADGHRVSTEPFNAKFTTNFESDTGYTKRSLLNRARNQNGNVVERDLGLTKELATLVNASRVAPNPVRHREVVSQPAAKIAVKTEGMYRVSRQELADAGFDVDSDPANWRLFVEGNEQAINVEAGGQYIEFYGKGMDTADSDTRIYYLISDLVTGKRMTTKFLGSIGGNVVSNNYRFIAEKKERISYNPSIHNGDTENYFGQAVISDPPLNETFILTSVNPSGPDAIVTVKLQGLLNVAHNVKVVLNGHEIGNMTGSGIRNFSADFTVPAAFLNEGTNTLTLNTLASSDVSYFDTVKVRYARKYLADQNRVVFFTPGYRRMTVGGFTSPNIRVFDTTLEGDPQLITDLIIEDNAGTFGVKMPSNRPAVMYAIEDTGLLHSPSVTSDVPSSLRTPDNTADVIIISHSAPDYLAAADVWANYRRGRTGGEFNVKVVDVVDVFDEFSYGVRTGEAIHDFLEYAFANWQDPKPAYVLLIGDASYDHRNYEGFGNWDQVPTRHISLLFEETGSDEALADFPHEGVRDGLADIPIGRIPARSSSVISNVFNKVVAFETPANQSIGRGALFAYDMPIGYDFRSMSEVLRNQLPASMPATFVARGLPEPNPNHIQDPMAHTNLMNALNTGKYVVNYSGHGSTGLWGSSSFFSNSDVSSLTNRDNQSIFTMLTCYNGLFFRPNFDSLGESLLKHQNGGAVATWSSSTETTPIDQLAMSKRFYQLIADGSPSRLGDLIKNAKSTIAGSDVGYSWVLLGDPMLKTQ